MFLVFNRNERGSGRVTGKMGIRGMVETFTGINLRLAGDSAGHLGLWR